MKSGDDDAGPACASVVALVVCGGDGVDGGVAVDEAVDAADVGGVGLA